MVETQARVLKGPGRCDKYSFNEFKKEAEGMVLRHTIILDERNLGRVADKRTSLKNLIDVGIPENINEYDSIILLFKERINKFQKLATLIRGIREDFGFKGKLTLTVSDPYIEEFENISGYIDGLHVLLHSEVTKADIKRLHDFIFVYGRAVSKKDSHLKIEKSLYPNLSKQMERWMECNFKTLRLFEWENSGKTTESTGGS